ncbi:MAG: CYTH domain-containing protein [Elusimicrobiota bacterium]
MNAKSSESELKFALADGEEWLRLVDNIRPVRATRVQTNIFLDSPGGDIVDARGALRVRHERVYLPGGVSRPQEHILLTLKHSGRRKDALFERFEHECEIATPLLEVRANPSQLLALDLAPITALKSLVPDIRELKVLGGFENLRYEAAGELELKGKKLSIVWEADRTTFGEGRTDYEVEIELTDAAQAKTVTAAVRGRLRALGIKELPTPESKFRRFLGVLKETSA